MGFAYGSPYGSPYYLGTSQSALAGTQVLDVALGGHPYLIDWSSDTPLNHIAIPIMREQADQSETPGEQSLNRQGLWRRSAETWHKGAGQTFYDREDSDRFRFNASKGADIWTKWEFCLLKDTEELDASVNSNLFMIVAGDFYYFTDGNDISYRDDLVSAPTVLTGTPTEDPTSIATDGFNIWTSHSTDGLYKTTRDTASTSSRITGTIELVAFVKDRVMVSDGDAIYDVTAEAMNTGTADPLPTALYTHPNIDWVWTSFGESSTHIYASGYSGDKSFIYSMTIAEDGTTIDPPKVALALPEGEVVHEIDGYLGQFLMIGTNKGWRFAVANENGSLTPGSFVETPLPVLAFEGQGNFIWYGWGNYDSSSTGLGRLSTSTIADQENLVPAYASDLMTDGTGNITSIVTFLGKTVFAVDGQGFFVESDDRVATGYVDSGLIGFGLAEPKLGLFLDVAHTGTGGSIDLQVRTQDSTFVSIGTHSGTHDDHTEKLIALGEATATLFEVRIVLNRDATDPTLCPEFQIWVLRVQPQAEPPPFYILATVLLAPEVETLVDTPRDYNTYAELDHIKEIHRSQEIATWQQGEHSWSVFVEEFDCQFHRLMHGIYGHKGFNGSVSLRMKVIQ